MSSRAPNSTSLPTTTPKARDDPQELSVGAIVGIVIGCFAVVVCIIVIAICCSRRRRRRQQCSSRVFKWTKKKKESSAGATITASQDAASAPVALPAMKHVTPKAIPATPVPVVHQHVPEQCPRDLCKEYSIHHLRLDKVYFDFQYNKCYCSSCYPSTKTARFTIAHSDFTAPRGWMRFGLKLDQAFADGRQILMQWYTSFYGTSKDKLESILANRFIPFPGDHLLSGQIFSTHLRDKTHVYTSPSIHYASLRHVCPTDTVKLNNVWYDVQIVLECKQNPHGIVKQQGCRRGVCEVVPDHEIEWKTDQRSSVVPYGLLIRARKHQCVKQCKHVHS